MARDEFTDARNSRPLLDQLKQRRFRSAVALLLYDPDCTINWTDVALNNSLGLSDYVALMLSQVNPATRYLNIDAGTEHDRLSHLAETLKTHSCILVTNFDIALTRLSFDERTRLWHNLLHHFPYRETALLIAMPQSASEVLPDLDALHWWAIAGKILSLTDL
jgi:hypothetical protein